MGFVEKTDSEKTIESIDQLKKGCIDAIDVIIEVYAEKLYRYCFSILKNRHDTEEALQDTFIKVYKKIEMYKAGTSFTAWIYQIARNSARDKLRINRKFKSVSSIDGDESDFLESQINSSFTSKTPDHDINMGELSKGINIVFEDMPEQYRDILYLRHLEDYSYEELSVILDCNVGTVKSRLSKARKIFVEKFKNNKI